MAALKKIFVIEDMMAWNPNLRSKTAIRTSDNRYFTQLIDIENELKHYKLHFKDKVVLCNCDDPCVSNLFLYFIITLSSCD